jgi:hypothetical protein
MARLLVLLFTLVALTGCTTEPGQGAPVAATTEQPAPVTVADPASIDIPAIGAKSTLIPLGLNPEGSKDGVPDGTLEVPDVKTPEQAGWFRDGGVKPGNVGPAVVVGHVDGGGRKGIFYRLTDLQIGDPVHVRLHDGRTLTFKVYREQVAPKDAFPTESVYGDTERPELRLITCTGNFVGGNLGYSSNAITYAVLAP